MKRGSEITSRIGKRPIVLPPGVTASVEGSRLQVEGRHGRESVELGRNGFRAELREGLIWLRPLKAVPENNARVGLLRALISNLVSGVNEPYLKQLELRGTGFRAELDGARLVLRLGFSHPISLPVPSDLEVLIEKQTLITIRGRRKDRVGEFAARLRSVRPPDPYKGKGVRYLGEPVSLKPGKAAKTVSGV